ncbi:MAG: flavin reductase family protein [Spirochaetales bacterium]|nr:flavin reductase family protein [Spirochaetales bacterium]
MSRVAIDPFESLPQVMQQMKRPGLLLTCGKEGNPITIGWGNVGVIWGKPVFSVLVRPSRYSFGLLEENGDFSVSIPEAGDSAMAKAVAWCGSHSGRDGDKWAGAGISKEPGITIDIPYVAECPIHYECRRLHVNDIKETTLDRNVATTHYPDGDLHRVWWGEILGAWKVG